MAETINWAAFTNQAVYGNPPTPGMHPNINIPNVEWRRAPQIIYNNGVRPLGTAFWEHRSTVAEIAVGGVAGAVAREGTRAALAALPGGLAVSMSAGFFAGMATEYSVQGFRNVHARRMTGGTVTLRDVLGDRDIVKILKGGAKGAAGGIVGFTAVELLSNSGLGHFIGDRISGIGSITKGISELPGNFNSFLGEKVNEFAGLVHDVPLPVAAGIGDRVGDLGSVGRTVADNLGNTGHEFIKDKPFVDRFAVEDKVLEGAQNYPQATPLTPPAEPLPRPVAAVDAYQFGDPQPTLPPNTPETLENTAPPAYIKQDGVYTTPASSLRGMAEAEWAKANLVKKFGESHVFAVPDQWTGEMVDKRINFVEINPETGVKEYKFDPFDGYYKHAYDLLLDDPTYAASHPQVVDLYMKEFVNVNPDKGLFSTGAEVFVPHYNSAGEKIVWNKLNLDWYSQRIAEMARALNIPMPQLPSTLEELKACYDEFGRLLKFRGCAPA